MVNVLLAEYPLIFEFVTEQQQLSKVWLIKRDRYKRPLWFEYSNAFVKCLGTLLISFWAWIPRVFVLSEDDVHCGFINYIIEHSILILIHVHHVHAFKP